jgi:hypothetical protein
MARPTKFGGFTYSIKAEGNRLYIYGGFAIDGKHDSVQATANKQGFLSRESGTQYTHSQSVTKIDTQKYFNYPSRVNADIGRKNINNIFVGHPKNNGKFEQEIENLRNRESVDMYISEYPGVKIKMNGEEIDNIRNKSLQKPYFYPKGAISGRVEIEPRISVVLSKNLVLIADNSSLDICDHADSERLTRNEFSSGKKAGIGGDNVLVEKSVDSSTYEYIDYCSRCERITNLI